MYVRVCVYVCVRVCVCVCMCVRVCVCISTIPYSYLTIKNRLILSSLHSTDDLYSDLTKPLTITVIKTPDKWNLQSRILRKIYSTSSDVFER